MKKLHNLTGLISTTILLLTLTGCSAEKEQEHDVNYYIEHHKERESKVDKCYQNPTAAQKDQNCKNAETAHIYIRQHGSMPKIK